MIMPDHYDHPYQCSCGKRYTTSRCAMKCCKDRSTNTDSGIVLMYSEERELKAQAADQARRDASYSLHHYECSCGERFKEVEQAKRCRKCRRYTDEGRCTEVIDVNTDTVVWDLGANAAWGLRRRAIHN